MENAAVRPESHVKQLMDLVTIVSTLYVCVELPLRLVMHYKATAMVPLFDSIVTLVFFLDMVLKFRTAEYVNGKWVEDLSVIRQHYSRSLGFKIDLISMLPLEIILAAAFPTFSYAPAFGLLRFLRLKALFKFTTKVQESKVIDPILLKILSLTFWVLLVAHWVSCGSIAIGMTSTENDDITNYVRAIYWCITTLSTVGYGDITPQTNLQRVYTMIVMILGAGFYGFIIGNVANILAKRDVAKMHHLEKMEKVNAFLRYRNIPGRIQQRIRNYYAYLWESRLGYDEASVLSDLPNNLKEEVALFLNREIIEKVAIFKGASEELIRDLVVQLKAVVFTPDDHVFKAGETGENMYFICRGKVEVTSRDGKTIYATLSDGNFFGEAALLTSQPRNASVRAVEYCDMYMLDKESFERVLGFYPEFAAHIHDLAEERRKAALAKAS